MNKKFKYKLILDHLGDRDYSHIDLVIRSGGMHPREVYYLLDELVTLGLVEKVEGNKFRMIQPRPVNVKERSWQTIIQEKKTGIIKILSTLLREATKTFSGLLRGFIISISKVTPMFQNLL